MLLCHQLGYPVSKPFGDRCKYDFIIDIDGELQRIQVKGTSRMEGERDAYRCCIASGSSKKEKYLKKDVDFIAVYVIPLDVWYMIPVDEIKGITINLYPHRDSRENMFEKYKMK